MKSDLKSDIMENEPKVDGLTDEDLDRVWQEAYVSKNEQRADVMEGLRAVAEAVAGQWRERIAGLEAENAALKVDKERIAMCERILDVRLTGCGRTSITYLNGTTIMGVARDTFTEAIDAALQATKTAALSPETGQGSILGEECDTQDAQNAPAASSAK